MATLTGFDITVELPAGWDGRVTRRGDGRPQAVVGPGGVTGLSIADHPVVHLANFALPEQRGDFGSGVVELMGPTDVFAVLFEYGPTAVGTPLFASVGVPLLDPSRFSPDTMQRRIEGQAGFQAFFQETRRAFTLYAVIGSYPARRVLVAQLDAVVRTVRIGQPVGAP
jgi:hypothetical protein